MIVNPTSEFEGLSYERMQALIRLQESESLFEAAGRDAGIQSRYSHYLKELSTHFGVKLTERQGRTLRLTPQGRALANLAREHLKTLEVFKRTANQTAEEWSIGADSGILSQVVIPSLAKLRRKDRPRSFCLSSPKAEQIALQLAEGQLDFGLLERSLLAEGLTAVTVFEVRYVVVVPSRIVPRGGVAKIGPALHECPHAIFDFDGRLGRNLAVIAARSHLTFNEELRCSSTADCIAAVNTGNYASVIPAHFIDPADAGDWVVIEDQALRILDQKIALAWNSHGLTLHGAQGLAFKGELVDAIKERSVAMGIEP